MVRFITPLMSRRHRRLHSHHLRTCHGRSALRKPSMHRAWKQVKPPEAFLHVCVRQQLGVSKYLAGPLDESGK